MDPSHDILRSGSHPLDMLFAPRSIAVIGATEKAGSVGRTLLWNLVSNPFGGTVYPVNPKRPSVLGIKAYANIAAVPEKVDLAVIASPAVTVPELIRECAAAGVKGAIVISAGFKEDGEAGAVLEQRVLQEARRGGIRLIGPNCLGVMNPLSGLNATFAIGIARPGNVGFISQSGALCTAVLDWSMREMVGFSAFVYVGSMVDVGWGDLIDYLGNDTHTHSILVYMESVGDARSFLSAAREVALHKPIIVLKAGRTEAAAKAAASHTGALTGSDEVLDAAFRRCGVLRVNTIADLFSMAEVLAKQPRPKGPRLAIVTNAGGPGVLAADVIVTAGGALAEISDSTRAQLNAVLPAHWSHNNPIDILGDADPARYAQTLDILAKDQGSDGLLVILTPQAMTDPTKTAELLCAYSKIENKPVLASWMGGDGVRKGRDILHRANIPVFDHPDTAARVFATMWRYSYNLRCLYETPTLPVVKEVAQSGPDWAAAGRIVSAARSAGRTLLSEAESKKLLAACGIPVATTTIALSPAAATKAADETGYPVVVKLHSETITHKTDVGGVILNVGDAMAVRAAFAQIEKSVLDKAGPGHFLGVTVQPYVPADGYEIILGSSVDPQFGPVLLFGMGGQMVEVLKDRALGLPPLNSTLALRMMERTRVFKALQGIRGRPPVDMAALQDVLVRFSYLVLEQRWIKEIDINPLMVSPGRVIALDARVLLHDASTREDQLPRLCIRPYPSQYISDWTMNDGMRVIVRPIRPEDEPLMIRFHKTLSEQSVYFRYFHMIKLDERVAHERLTRVCFNDYDREIALVVERHDPQSGESEIIAVGRLSKLPSSNEAEFSILVNDVYQHRGLGTELLHRLLLVGKAEGLSRIVAKMMPDNLDMQHICEKLGFRMDRSGGDSLVGAVLEISREK